MAVNVIGTMLVSEAATPHLRESHGSIVNVSSIAAVRAFGAGPYSASKSAIIAMTTDLAYALGPSGVRVNCIVVGHIYAPMGAFGGDDAQRALRRRANVLGTEGDAWDVARAAGFLAGPDARWITGVALPVDAGTTLATGLGMFGRMSEPPPD
jgi:NAD(P)-dependent dehydrogenase (short-subunit alcohol dehydrogenase family)